MKLKNNNKQNLFFLVIKRKIESNFVFFIWKILQFNETFDFDVIDLRKYFFNITLLKTQVGQKKNSI